VSFRRVTIERVQACTASTDCCAFLASDKGTNTGASGDDCRSPGFATELRFMAATCLTFG
jgi:hypothetical protein